MRIEAEVVKSLFSTEYDVTDTYKQLQIKQITFCHTLFRFIFLK